MTENEQPTVDCFVNTCDGNMQILLDGTAVCERCGLTERQWTEPRPDEPVSNAKEFSGYADNIEEYVHADFDEWYEDYIKLLDVYYKRQRGWPSEEAKYKFHDLYMLTPIKMVQWINSIEEERQKAMRQAKRDLADKVNRRRNGGV